MFQIYQGLYMANLRTKTLKNPELQLALRSAYSTLSKRNTVVIVYKIRKS